MVIKRCPRCNSLFEPTSDGQEFCKPDCEPSKIVIDPVTKYLASIQFGANLFVELEKAWEDPDTLAKFFQTPDVLVLMHEVHQMEFYDPNRDGPGEIDHKAFINLLKWMIVKYTNDPVWFCYIGHLIRFLAAYSQPSSNFPIRTSPRFYPDNFIKRGEPINFSEENKKVENPQDIFKRKRKEMEEKRFGKEE